MEPSSYQGPGVYKHHKGKHYYVFGIAKHSETDEQLVVYMPLYLSQSGLQYTVRPLGMFNEILECETNGAGDVVRILRRFVKV